MPVDILKNKCVSGRSRGRPRGPNYKSRSQRLKPCKPYQTRNNKNRCINDEAKMVCAEGYVYDKKNHECRPDHRIPALRD